MSTWHRFFVALGGQHEAQNPPKMRSKRLQNRWKIYVQGDAFFCMPSRSIFSVFLAQHGPKWVSKRDPKSGRRTAFWRPFWASWGSWGPRPSKIRFSLIFETNMAPNEFPQRTKRRVGTVPFLALFGCLGALGAQDPPRPDFYWFFIDLGTILDRFWASRSLQIIDFGRLLGLKIPQEI